MPCAEALNTQALVDGEVGGPEAEAIERHIEGCAECQALRADAAALREAIHAHAPRYAAPASLRRRIDGALAAEEALAAHPRRSPAPARAAFWRGVMSGAGVGLLAAGLAVVALLPPSPSTLAGQVTLAHTDALMGGREIQVASSDHHTVKPWFAGRAPISPPVADFGAQGYTLVGGRLDKVAGSPAAVVVYRHGKHEIDLFVWADRGSVLPPAGSSHGYHSIFWKSRDLDFAAVSDTSAPELASFVDLVRTEPE